MKSPAFSTLQSALARQHASKRLILLLDAPAHRVRVAEHDHLRRVERRLVVTQPQSIDVDRGPELDVLERAGARLQRVGEPRHRTARTVDRTGSAFG